MKIKYFKNCIAEKNKKAKLVKKAYKRKYLTITCLLQDFFPKYVKNSQNSIFLKKQTTQ